MPDINVMISVAGVALNACLLVFVLAQLRAANKANREDHDRRKKQATIEWFAATLDQRAEYVDRLPQDRDSAGIASFLKKVKGRANLDIIGYLNVYEALATAVNMGIHDLDVIERLSGGRIRTLYRAYEPWIAHRREILNSHPYVELEMLTLVLEDRASARDHPTDRKRWFSRSF